MRVAKSIVAAGAAARDAKGETLFLRGARSRVAGRFEPDAREAFDDGWTRDDAPAAPLETRVTLERARSIIATNDAPDIPFEQSINPYRGCEHGCVYCYARPSHAYLELSPGLDFETKLFAKTNAAELLRQALSKPGYEVKPIAFGTNTDCYQPIERRHRIMREILEVLTACEHPFSIVTKSALVERDLDLLAPMARRNLVQVFVSINTLDRGLARRVEPRAASPQRRLDVLRTLAREGVPCGVMVAPVIPALTDKSIEEVLEAAAAAGASTAGYILMRLPHEVKPIFKEWLAAHYPQRADHVMSLVRQLRGGRENDPNFGTRMTGTGTYAELIAGRFKVACRHFGLNRKRRGEEPLDCSRFRPPPIDGQLELF
ncbi:MAG: PA0069 family radical SAM protein [Betaproteobacteria bacterium]|nr:MAG: PA0069 family radical SAM protein [Betaproteobacteria bacterium]